MSLSNTMLQFNNWGDDFRFSGGDITYAWDGIKKYYTAPNQYQDFVWMKVHNSTREVITAGFKRNKREFNNRRILGVDDAGSFYTSVLEANGMVTLLTNEPFIASSKERLQVGVNPNHVAASYQLPNLYFDPLAAPGNPFYYESQFGPFSALEVRFTEYGGGRELRILTPAYFGPDQSWKRKVAREDLTIYPGVVRINNFEFVVTDPAVWDVVSESVFLLAPECCA